MMYKTVFCAGLRGWAACWFNCHRTAAAVLIVLCSLLGGIGSVAAARPYQGVYVVMDPYSTADYKRLQQSAATACPTAPQAKPPSAFCGAVDGIVLRIGWCRFELYHVTHDGIADPSCHYVLGYSGGVGSSPKQISTPAAAEYLSPCRGNFDVCSGKNASVLGAALGYIRQINANRALTQYLPALKLSVGLSAGVWTPQTVLDRTGSVDVPHNPSVSGEPAMTQCFRLPLVWQANYLTAYDNAIDRLLAYIVAQLPGGANITVLKASGITGNDLEVEMPGRAVALSVPEVDPRSPFNGPGLPLHCSSSVPGAATWLAAYNAGPVNGRTFSQAVEHSFGALIGHESAALANNGLAALLSIPNTGSTAFSSVDCGTSGGGTCMVSGNTGNWSVYYLMQYVDDLFNGGLAATAASQAYTAARPGGSFTLLPAQLSLNWTGVTVTAIDSLSQVTCNLNNTDPADDRTFPLDGIHQQVPGAGTTIGWQTSTELGRLCVSTPPINNAYRSVIEHAIEDGGQFIEVQTDAAFDDIATCGADLAAASSQVLAVVAPTVCTY